MSKYRGKKVLIVGFGLSGVAVARYMGKQGARITVTDMKQRTEFTKAIDQTVDLKIEFEFGRHSSKYFLGADLIVVSPGVPLNIKPLEEAREKGIPITSEVDLAAGALKEPLVAITGTNGKTTTTVLVGEIFKAEGRPVYVGGNVGKPLLDYVTDEIKANVVVAELSSFQLQLTEKMVPAVAIFTNVDQDHMDRYGDMQSYVEAKKCLLRRCDRNSYVVLNYDDPIVSGFAAECPGKVIWFTKRNPMHIGGEFAERFCGAYFNRAEKRIYAKISGEEEVYDLARLRIFGDHNRENLMAALCTARLMGVQPAAIRQTIENFKGVEHRLEFVRRKDGVYFFNDSKSTNVMSLQRSLMAFEYSPIVLIAGGRDKDMDFSPLTSLVREKCKLLILVGEAKEKLNRVLGDYVETYLVGTFEEAILLAYQKSRSGDIILLSPGCASYDMFRNYEERGEYFKKLVNQL